MSITILQDSIERMMAKCGWRCCICRRFRPTKLKVDRIVEKADEDSDDDDNLIVTCLSCRTDIHTKVPFSRRFSDAELRGNRNTLIALVAVGSLPIDDSDKSEEVIARLLAKMRTSRAPTGTLLPEAIEILLRAAFADGESQGAVSADRHVDGISLLVGGISLDVGNRRSQARYEAAFEELLHSGLLTRRSSVNAVVTYDGYLAADELSAMLADEQLGSLSQRRETIGSNARDSSARTKAR